jgi:hypothetical protein
MHAESSPTGAMRPAVLELVPELLNLDEVLIVILILLRWVNSVAGLHERDFTPRDIAPVPRYRRI